MLLRFTQIFIRPKVLFIRENYSVTLSIIFSVTIVESVGEKYNFAYVELMLFYKELSNFLSSILSTTLSIR